MDEIKEKREAPVYKAGLMKRTFAGLIDLVIAGILAVLLITIAFSIGKALSPEYDTKYETYMSYYVDSGLALREESIDMSSNMDSGLDSKDEYIQTVTQIKEIDEKDYLINSKRYFEVYCSSEYEGVHACSTYGKTFKEVIENDEQLMKYGTYNEETYYELKDEYKENEESAKSLMQQARRYIYGMALNDIQQSELFLEALNYTKNVQDWAIVSGIVVSLCLVYLLPTMVTKKGQTIGKLIFKLSITNHEGFKVKKSQLFVRFLAFSVINILLGKITVLLVPLISFTCMIFTKRNSALHDYCAVTMVVDDKASVIYNSKKEFEEAMEKEENRFAEIEKNRKNYYDTLKK